MKKAEFLEHKDFDKTGHTAEQIAVWIIAQFDPEYGDMVSPLKLQKLLYYVQAWVLVDYNKILFPEDFEAWPHGPVVPSVYRKYKHFGWNGIETDGVIPVIADSNLLKILRDIIDAYGEHTAKYLERLTHSEDPWKKARRGLTHEEKSENIIKIEWIYDYYSKIEG